VEAYEQLKNLAGNSTNDAASQYQSLTERQQEVMRLLVQGLSYKTIAEQLGISMRTVVNHRSQIMRRLGVTTRAELTRFASGLGFVDVAP
jgi:DNA-binding NarL/FixJ family response regulator